jgi:hypothetical protein
MFPIIRRDVTIQVFLAPVIHTIYVMVTVVRKNLNVIALSMVIWKQYVLPWIMLLTAVIILVIVGRMSTIWQLWGLVIYFMNPLK